MPEEVTTEQGYPSLESWQSLVASRACLPGHRGVASSSPEQRIAEAGQPQDVGGTEQWGQLD